MPDILTIALNLRHTPGQMSSGLALHMPWKGLGSYLQALTKALSKSLMNLCSRRSASRGLRSGVWPRKATRSVSAPCRGSSSLSQWTMQDCQ